MTDTVLTDTVTVDAPLGGPGPDAGDERPGPSGREDAIVTRDLVKVYGSLKAVDHVSLRVPAGSVFGLIGPNGAGKTTTFSILATLLLPTSGAVRVAGIDPLADPYAVRAKLGYMPDVVGVYDNLTVGEYLRFFATAYQVPRSELAGLVDRLLELVDLTGKFDAMVNSLSRGMKQRLSLARALVHDPEILILDEPASGLDPRARVDLRDLVSQLCTMGKTIVISSHILAELEEMCTDIGILEAGRLLVSGPPSTIHAQLGGSRQLEVRFADGTVESHAVGSVAEQVALLQRLVSEEGREVVEFKETSGGIEDLFLRITKGTVQ